MDTFFISINVAHYNYIHNSSLSKHYLAHHNYNPSWVQRYLQRNYSTIDPAVFNAKLYGFLSSWKEACDDIKKN